MSKINHTQYEIIDKIAEFFGINEENLKQFFILFGIGVFYYFFWFRTFLFSIDSPFALDYILKDDTSIESIQASQGRWLVLLYARYLVPKFVIPFIGPAIACVSISLAYILIIKSHNLNFTKYIYLAFPVFCAFPTLDYLLEYHGAEIHFISIFFVSLALYLIHIKLVQGTKIGFLKVLLSSLLVAMSLGSYQSLSLIFLCGGLGIVILNTDNNIIEIIKRLQYLLLVYLIAICINRLFIGIFLNLYNTKLTYLDNYINMDNLINSPYYMITLLLNHLLAVYSGSKKFYAISMFAIAIVTTLAITSLLITNIRKSIVNILLISPILLIPFLMDLIFGYPMHPRTLTAVPYVVWLLTIIAYKNHFAILKICAVFAVILLNIQILYALNVYGAVRLHRQDQDNFLANDLYLRIAKANQNFDINKIYNISIYGSRQVYNFYPAAIYGTAIGDSIFGPSLPSERSIYINLMEGTHLQDVDAKKQAELIPYFQDMPIWPNEGSVKVVDDITLIKLSN